MLFATAFMYPYIHKCNYTFHDSPNGNRCLILFFNFM